MKSHKEYKNEYQHWLDEIQALNKAVQHDAKKWKIVGCFFALCAVLSERARWQGAITTLGVLCVLLKRRTAACQNGSFAVF